MHHPRFGRYDYVGCFGMWVHFVLASCPWLWWSVAWQGGASLSSLGSLISLSPVLVCCCSSPSNSPLALGWPLTTQPFIWGIKRGITTGAGLLANPSSFSWCIYVICLGGVAEPMVDVPYLLQPVLSSEFGHHRTHSFPSSSQVYFIRIQSQHCAAHASNSHMLACSQFTMQVLSLKDTHMCNCQSHPCCVSWSSPISPLSTFDRAVYLLFKMHAWNTSFFLLHSSIWFSSVWCLRSVDGSASVLKIFLDSTTPHHPVCYHDVTLHSLYFEHGRTDWTVSILSWERCIVPSQP